MPVLLLTRLPCVQAAAGGVKEVGSRALNAAEQAAKGAYYGAKGELPGCGSPDLMPPLQCSPSVAARLPDQCNLGCLATQGLQLGTCVHLPSLPSHCPRPQPLPPCSWCCAEEEMVCVPVSAVKSEALSTGAPAGKL